MSKISSIYLSKEQYNRMKQVCEKEDCTPYHLAKRALVEHIWAYPLEKAPAEEKEPIKQDLEKVDNIVPEPETSKIDIKMDVEAVSDTVRRILEGKT